MLLPRFDCPAAKTNTDQGVSVRYSIVIPVYGNEETIEPLINQLRAISDQLDGAMESVFVVDGSPDNSMDRLMVLLPDSGLESQVISHSRNFGSFPAIRTGLSWARGDYIGVMAADLQEPPQLMVEFFRSLSAAQADIAVGRRVTRADPALSSLASRTFWGLYRRVINPQIPQGGVDVFACTQTVASQLLELNEAHSFLIGLLYWIGFRRIEIPYERLPRTVGTSGWTFRKRVGYLMDSLFSFTDIPIKMLGAVGGVGAVVTTVAAIVVLVAWLAGGITSPGYTPLMLVILLSTFMLLGGLGIVGAYVHRTFENTKERPIAIVMSHETISSGA